MNLLKQAQSERDRLRAQIDELDWFIQMANWLVERASEQSDLETTQGENSQTIGEDIDAEGGQYQKIPDRQHLPNVDQILFQKMLSDARERQMNGSTNQIDEPDVFFEPQRIAAE